MSDGNGLNPRKEPPSLLTGASHGQTGGDSRILAELDGRGGKATAAKRGGKRASAVAIGGTLVALAAAMVWGAAVYWPHRGASMDTRVASDGDAAPLALAAVATGLQHATTPVAGDALPVTHAATIVNDSTATTADPASSRVPMTSGVTEASTSTSMAASTSANGVSSTSASSLGAPIGPAALSASTPLPTSTASTMKPAKHAAAGPTPHASHPASARESDAALARRRKTDDALAARSHERQAPRTRNDKLRGRDDPDADLLAALFKHSSDEERPSKASDRHAAKARHERHASSARRAAAAPAAADSLAGQLQACREKGFFGGEICRWRACDGHWGKDAACPSRDATGEAGH